MTEDQYVIHTHINKKKRELNELKEFWARFLEWNDLSPFSKNTFTDVQTKVSSILAQVERSINDHMKLMPPEYNGSVS